MNRSNTTPRFFSTDQLHAALGDIGGPARPDYLPDIVAQAGRMRQRPAWTFLERWLSMDIAVRRQGVPRAAVALAALSLLIALLAAGAVYIGSQLTKPERAPRLPTTPGSWSRVVIETPSGTGRVVSLAASPRGLLAIVADDQSADLVASADGHDWTLVPSDQHPSLQDVVHPGPSAAVVGTDRGFLMVGSDVWFSENGFNWQRLASSADDPDLRAGSVFAMALGGPGFVAVGSDNMAWYSTDGTDWSLAQVPPPPTQLFESQGFAAPTVDMHGVAVAGDTLVALGLAIRHTADSGLTVPVMWASDDGRTWANVLDAPYGEPAPVAAGPGGFVAVDWDQDGPADQDQVIVRMSADGKAWQPVASFGPTWSTDADKRPVGLGVSSIAATESGFVAAGEFGQVCLITCEPGEVVIWTSADGRSWSRLPSDERFARAAASDIVAWGSRFVVGGWHEDQPVIWISE